eukprot:2399348-Rhodomonas_salina.1
MAAMCVVLLTGSAACAYRPPRLTHLRNCPSNCCHHTLPQYRTAPATLRYLSTAQLRPPHAISAAAGQIMEVTMHSVKVTMQFREMGHVISWNRPAIGSRRAAPRAIACTSRACVAAW